jgi:hypothetical protein
MMRWVTRDNVRVGRVACTWLIERFIDPGGTIEYVDREDVDTIVEAGAVAFHTRGSRFNHNEGHTPFEALLEAHDLSGDPALALMGRIVNGADTNNTMFNQPEGPGLRAIVEGLRELHPADDRAVLDAGARVCDAVYAYCRHQTARIAPTAEHPAKSSASLQHEQGRP